MARKVPKTAWKKGQSGNPKGRPPAPEIEALRKAVATVEKRKKKKFFIHAIEQAYEDNKVLIAVLKKLVPDLKFVENEHGANKSAMAAVVQAVQAIKNAKS